MTRKMLKPGRIVLCRYFNSVDRKFYGEHFKAEYISKEKCNHPNYLPSLPDRDYYKVNYDHTVKRLDDDRIITVHRKEIVRILE